ncbi:putative BmoZ (butane monooxygenase component A gamma chain) like protein [Methylocella tundrae]|nr:putative BmoZ (butane monooxygenase component A gamma chain) like protein [Methylocella tundrae]
MAFTNKFLRDEDRSLYDNEIRRSWRDRIAALNNLDEAVAILTEIRTQHVGPERKTFDLEYDSLWIEAEAEGRVASLKSEKFHDAELLDKCVCGTAVADVYRDLRGRVDAAGEDQFALERLAAEFRRKFKPPVMPVNAWLELDSYLSKRLLETRAKVADIAAINVEEWRAKRGFRVLVEGHGNTMKGETA